jgi:hypothetical protein
MEKMPDKPNRREFLKKLGLGALAAGALAAGASTMKAAERIQKDSIVPYKPEEMDAEIKKLEMLQSQYLEAKTKNDAAEEKRLAEEIRKQILKMNRMVEGWGTEI